MTKRKPGSTGVWRHPKIPFRFLALPKCIIENCLPRMNLAEIRVYLYICYRTWGFNKSGDSISISQISKGLVDYSGKRHDFGTGLSRRTVQRAIDRLIEMKLLAEVKKYGMPSFYSVETAVSVLLVERTQRRHPYRKVAYPGTPVVAYPRTPTREEVRSKLQHPASVKPTTVQ